MDIDYLEQAIGAMLMAKVITFEANSWAFGFVGYGCKKHRIC